jgi:hypothetical protein
MAGGDCWDVPALPQDQPQKVLASRGLQKSEGGVSVRDGGLQFGSATSQPDSLLAIVLQ